QMNALEPLRIQEAGRIAHNHPSVAGKLRHGEPPAVWHRLCAIADHLSAFQQFRYVRMLLQLLQHTLRIKPRISVIEAGNVTKREEIIFRSVGPRSAI